MEQKEKYYTIMVHSDKASEQELGFLNKETMTPMGQTTKITMALGEISIPNFSRIWGKLTRDKNNVLTGKFTPMEYGAEGGAPIELRYLKSSPSLSVQYQLEVMKITPDKIAAMTEGTDITLTVGLNEYDYTKDRQLIEMLQNHYMNQDCVGRNPDSETIVFSEYDSGKVVEKSAAMIDKRREAEDYILNASRSTRDGLFILANIIGVDGQQQPDFVFRSLMDKLDEPEGVKTFLDKMEKAKHRVHNMLLDAVENDALRGAEGSEVTIAAGRGGKHVPLFKDHIQKDEKDVVKYLMANFMDPEFNESFSKIEEALKGMKEAVLN